MNKVNYLAAPVIIILLVGNVFLYSKIGRFKKDASSQTPKTGSENIFSDLNFSVLKKTPDDWKTYRSEKYGFEFKYPPKSGQFDNKITEDERSNFEMSLNYDFIDAELGEKREIILGINKGNVSSEDEMKKIIQALINDELDRRNNIYLQNSEKITTLNKIIVYKLFFLTKSICKNSLDKIGGEDLYTYYYIPNYEQNLFIALSTYSRVAFNQCSIDDFIPLYYQPKEFYQNQMKQLIIDDKIISSFKFIK